MRTRRQLLRGLGYLAVLLIISLALTALIWADHPQTEGAPLGTELKPVRAPSRPADLNPVPPGKGFVPPKMDLSHLTGQRMPEVASAPPSSFDWRSVSTGMVTSVKNQGSCGSCYAFAAIANFESALLIRGEGSRDYSENNVKECTYGSPSCSGGNYYGVASFLSQNGTVRESCDPYVASDVSCKGTCAYQKTLLDWRIISERSVPNPSVLKAYIQTHGPVYTTIYAGDGDAWDTEFNNYNGNYTLYHAGSENTNHAVMIVGWDDSLSHQGGTGAWIVKNSWGTGWGGTCGYGAERGYFTIAYGSANIGMWSAFVYDWQDYDSSGGLMYFDEGGWTEAYGYTGSTTAWGLCRFTPTESTNVTRVEIWTSDITTDVDLYLYDNFNASTGTPSTLLHSDLNHSFSEAGYHSVVVSPPLAVNPGDDVVAVVKFTNSSYAWPVAVDDEGPSATQRTYLSRTGNNGTWTDMGTAVGVDIAIRLRTSSTLPAPTTTPDGPGGLIYLPLVEKNWSAGSATAEPGSWSGTTVTTGYPGRPKTLSFVVNPGGTAMLHPQVITYYECWTGFSTIGWRVTWTIGHDITINPGGTFYFDEDFNYGLHHLIWQGRFTSAYTAEGTYTLTHYTAECGYETKSGTWTAAYVGPATSEPSDLPTGIHAVVERHE